MLAWDANRTTGATRCPYCSRPWHQIDVGEKEGQPGQTDPTKEVMEKTG